MMSTVWHTVDAKNPLLLLHLGILHIPSLIFIGLSAILMHLFIKSKVQGAKQSHHKMKKEFQEATTILSFDNKNAVQELIKSDNSFCKDIKVIMLNGGIEEDIELVINKNTSAITSVYEKLLTEYSFIITILPMLGMVGTITGLLQMFAITDGVDNFAEKFASLSVALATTLYATLWVILITKPKSKEIENALLDIDRDEYLLVINSKLFLHNGDMMELHEEDALSKQEIKEET